MPHFKSELKKLSNSNSVNIPKYYSYGPRKLNIVLTQFRCPATFLNYDLFKVNIISNPSCSCDAIQEDSKMGHRSNVPYGQVQVIHVTGVVMMW
jgi:hypothetical protein